MMKKYFFFFICVVFFRPAFAQLFGNAPQVTNYVASAVVDPDYGIRMYEKLNFMVNGDSVRNDRKGYACQGWIQDTYLSGAIIHKGYYEDGHLKIYKNFFENGNVERSFRVIDFKRCNMQIYYPDGKIKSDITYYNGQAQIWTDYYPNGQVEYFEENTKSMEYLISRKSFSETGKSQEIFDMVDKKKKLYSKKEYYESGNLKAEGPMIYNNTVGDYQKDGVWKNYDESGKQTSEETWVYGKQK